MGRQIIVIDPVTLAITHERYETICISFVPAASVGLNWMRDETKCRLKRYTSQNLWLSE